MTFKRVGFLTQRIEAPFSGRACSFRTINTWSDCDSVAEAIGPETAADLWPDSRYTVARPNFVYTRCEFSWMSASYVWI